jgi:hypothetical protein
MNIPTIRGLIDRRLLVNFRVAPDVIARQLPAPFRPKLTPSGHAMAGICLIRLRDIRPVFMPGLVGIRSENAAHRIAVEWDTARTVQTGVFIPRRDTSSRINALAGGRIFPGWHNRASFEVVETDRQFRVELRSVDGEVRVFVDAQLASNLPPASAFASLAEASAFFETGSLGYSATPHEGRFDGLELRSFVWRVEPLEVSAVVSSYFEDLSRFPIGSIEFDSALLMRNIPHEWRARELLEA